MKLSPGRVAILSGQRSTALSICMSGGLNLTQTSHNKPPKAPRTSSAHAGQFGWAEARIKIARMTLTIKLDRNWSSFQLANSAPPLSVTDSAIAPSARMQHAHAKGKASHLKMTTVRFRQLFQKNVSHLLKANHCTSILYNNELRQVDCSAALSWDPKVPQKLRKSH